MLSYSKTMSENESYKYIVWATQMPNSNTNTRLFPKLINIRLIHANPNSEEGILCNQKSLTQLKGNLAKLKVYIRNI